MQIHGLNKTTLLDYPGHVAATIFLGNCNFRCPFCQNRDLVLDPASQPVIPITEILDFLKLRSGVLSGVCITGGEPTLQTDLPEFISAIKELGYLVKLDTNGSNPRMIKTLYEHHLIDYVAMDIKSSPHHYAKVAGLTEDKLDLSAVKRSVEYLMSCGIHYEFRTTVVKELHDATDFTAIADWIGGCEAYYLQAYKDSDTVIQQGFHSYTKEELLTFLDILKPSIATVALRGID
ncbi:MAG: anaerobic ribonucleoside-triphosphate reductase activating protein [Lachnospiraceae bacterium]